MDYVSFRRAGEARWDRFELGLLAAEKSGLRRVTFDDLEALVAGHRAVLADFAYARTHFRHTDTERRLRSLVHRGHALLARPPRRPWAQAWHFLWNRYPAVFRRSWKAVAAANAVMWGSTLLGFAIAAGTPTFANLFLSPDMQQGLAHGQMWTDDLVMKGAPLATRIGTNNIAVAFTCWGGGILAGLLTVFMLFENGLMLGAVWAATAHAGLGGRLVAWIAAHGPLELFLITVAGGAGFELARGLVEDRGQPRSRTMARAGRRSVELMMGTVPWFAVAAFTEGYLSPQDTDVGTKGLVGAALLTAFVLYAWRPTSAVLELEDPS